MSARAKASCVIGFGLVTIQSRLYPMTLALDPSFNRGPNGTRRFAVAPDRFVSFTAAELAAFEDERTDRVELVEFVPLATFDRRYVRTTDYLGPDRGGDRAWALLASAMTRTATIAIGTYAARGRNLLVALEPHSTGLLLHRLWRGDEVRDADNIDRPGAIEFKAIEMELAEQLITRMTSERFDPERYPDEHRARVDAAIAAKVEQLDEGDAAPAMGGRTPIATAPRSNVIDLFAHLRRSLGG